MSMSKASPHGQNINNEYITSKNPDIILAMDRGQVVSGKSSAKQTLSNDVIKDVNAVKNGNVYELDLNYGTLALVQLQQQSNKLMN